MALSWAVAQAYPSMAHSELPQKSKIPFLACYSVQSATDRLTYTKSMSLPKVPQKSKSCFLAWRFVQFATDWPAYTKSTSPPKRLLQHQLTPCRIVARHQDAHVGLGAYPGPAE